MSEGLLVWNRALISGRALAGPDFSLKTNRHGLSTASQTFACLHSELVARLADFKPWTPHPTFTALLIDDVNTRQDGPVSFISVTWSGVSSATGTPPQAVYSMRQIKQTAPIEAHPNFATLVTKAGGEGGNKAIFQTIEGQKKFVAFGKDAAEGLAGVQDFEYTTFQWIERSVVYARPVPGANYRKIDTPPNAPEVAEGYNWRFDEFDYDQRGTVYDLTRGWTLSGPNGWNQWIYGSTSGL